jgi:hypothetical protein
VLLAVIVWWIATLWFDEPGSPAATASALPAAPEEPAPVAQAEPEIAEAESE